MRLNRSGTRSDLPYLRRRQKSVPAPARAQPSESATARDKTQSAPSAGPSPAGGLSLSRPQGNTAGSGPARGTSAAAGAVTSGGGLSLSRPQGNTAGSGPARGASAAAGAGTSGGTGLSLSRTPAGTSSPTGARTQAAATSSATARHTSPDTSGEQLFPAPGVQEVKQLDGVHPLIRLNSRQSAVGSLIVTGASAIVWESSTFITGALTVDGSFAGTPIDTSGHRPLVGYAGVDAVVALRHIRELRRVLFIGRGPEPLGVQLFDGATVGLPPAGGGKEMFVLALLRVGGLIELRAEVVPAEAPDLALWQEFGFTMTARAARQRNRS